MSHFTVLVFGSESDVEELLAPYDENIDVPKYVEEVLDDWDKASMVDFYVNQYLKEGKAIPTLEFEDMYYLHGKDWDGRVCKKNPMTDEWERWSTYNPKSKWDWYSIGGSCTVDRLPEDFVPFAYVTPDGEWHEKGQMGWWACVSNEQSDEAWEQEFRTAIKGYTGIVTLVDCHI